LNEMKKCSKYFNQDVVHKVIGRCAKEFDLKGFDEFGISYLQYGLYQKLYTIIEDAIHMSRKRQFLYSIPAPNPPKQVSLLLINKAVRLVPTVESGTKLDSIDLLLTNNPRTRKRKLEDWGKRKEKERCRSIIDNLRKDKTVSKTKHKKVIIINMYRSLTQ